jgi:LPXTG-motif cell wall-anchored protein
VQENKNTVYLQYSNNPNGDTTDLGKTAEDHVWVFTYQVQNTKTDENNAPLAGAGFRLYTDEACTSEYPLIFDNTLDAYRPVKGEEAAAEMFSAAETGKFNIVGLDAGIYYLKETTVPGGYNNCENVQIVISATHAEAADGASATTAISEESSKGTVNIIINKSGMALPETGGIGTTVLYIVGGILVLGAVVLLVTKKRMASN